MQKTFSSGQRLAGIIYLHPITDTRLRGSSIQSLRLFDKLCGGSDHRNVLLVTTFWNSVKPEVGESRERQLEEHEGFWKSLKDRGSRTTRVGVDYNKFKNLLAGMARVASENFASTTNMFPGEGLESAIATLSIQPEKEPINTGKLIVSTNNSRQLALVTNESDMLEVAQNSKWRELETAHATEIEAKRQELEKQKRKLQQREKEKQTRERKGKQKLQTEAASHRYQASLIQRDRVDAALDNIRVAYSNGNITQSITGVALNAVGMHAVDEQGRTITGGGVTRSNLSHWCDACRHPVGCGGHASKSRPCGTNNE
jgi:hypothetical protein